MKKNNLRMAVLLLLFAILLVPFSGMETNAGVTQKKVTAKAKKPTKVKKPGQVKGLKKVKESCKWDGYRNVSSVKISFKKVNGATGYQVSIYEPYESGLQTPLLYAKTTKKTTYTIPNLVPAVRYTIKVRAYTKGKNGKIVYGKTKSIKVKTGGRKKGQYYTCNSCGTGMPGNAWRITEHGEAVYKVHKEIHAGGTYYWK